MEIRRLTQEDVPQFHALLARVFEEMRDVFYPGELIDAFLEIYLEDKLRLRFDQSKHIGIGAFEDGDLLGIVWGWDDNTKVFQLEWLAVLPEARGKGVGRALMHALEEELRFQGFWKLSFVVSVKNIPAIKRYIHMAYRIEGVHPNHHFGWDFLSFGKILLKRQWTGPVMFQPDFEIEDFREIYGGYGEE